MKKFSFLLLLIFCFNLKATESNYRVAIDHPLEIYPGGSLDEAIDLSKQWRDKVLLKNPFIDKVEYLLEKQSDTRYLLLVIYHYRNQEAAAKANQQIANLIQQAWPDATKKDQFFKQLQSYVVQAEKKTHRFELVK